MYGLHVTLYVYDTHMALSEEHLGNAELQLGKLGKFAEFLGNSATRQLGNSATRQKKNFFFRHHKIFPTEKKIFFLHMAAPKMQIKPEF